MDRVEIEITGMAITQRYGSLDTGTILRTDAAFAKHLVDECQCAKYTRPVQTSAQPTRTAKPKAK